jgi:hypothetical protein
VRGQTRPLKKCCAAQCSPDLHEPMSESVRVAETAEKRPLQLDAQ